MVSVSKFVVVFCLLVYIIPTPILSSLISSSEVQFCRRSSRSFEPFFDSGDACEKKFLVTLAVRNGQASVENNNNCSYLTFRVSLIAYMQRLEQ